MSGSDWILQLSLSIRKFFCKELGNKQFSNKARRRGFKTACTVLKCAHRDRITDTIPCEASNSIYSSYTCSERIQLRESVKKKNHKWKWKSFPSYSRQNTSTLIYILILSNNSSSLYDLYFNPTILLVIWPVVYLPGELLKSKYFN